LLKKLVKENNGKKVVLISHSMGCPFTYYLFMKKGDQFVKDYIHTWIPTAPAWMGAPKALKAMFNFNLLEDLGGKTPFWKWKKEQDRAVLHVTPLTRKIPSVWFLLPQEKAFGDKVILKTPKKEYKFNQIKEILNTIGGSGYADGRFDEAKTPFKTINNYEKKPPVPIYVAYGKGEKTAMKLELKEELDEWNLDKEWPLSIVRYGDGDGTVPIQSLSFFNNQHPKDKDVKELSYENADHVGILEDDRYLLNALNLACGMDIDYDEGFLGLPWWAWLLIAVGAVALIIVIIVLICCCCCK